MIWGTQCYTYMYVPTGTTYTAFTWKKGVCTEQTKQAADSCMYMYTEIHIQCSVFYLDCTLTNGAIVTAQLAGLNQHMHKQIKTRQFHRHTLQCIVKLLTLLSLSCTGNTTKLLIKNENPKDPKILNASP